MGSQVKIVKPKSSPKSKSQIQVPNPKFKVQRKGTGTKLILTEFQGFTLSTPSLV